VPLRRLGNYRPRGGGKVILATVPKAAALQGKRGARATGLEPATSGVTGRCSDQLNYARSVGYGSASGPACRGAAGRAA
jgi:hypothetical protein